MAIRELAGRDGAQRALPAVLGCVESALDSLAGATETAHASHAAFGDEHVHRLSRGLVNLERALDDAKLAASAARGLAGRGFATGEP